MNLADKLSGWEKEVTADLNIHVAQHFFFFCLFYAAFLSHGHKVRGKMKNSTRFHVSVNCFFLASKT